MPSKDRIMVLLLFASTVMAASKIGIGAGFPTQFGRADS
jgi:hypothetical protein